MEFDIKGVYEAMVADTSLVKLCVNYVRGQARQEMLNSIIGVIDSDLPLTDSVQSGSMKWTFPRKARNMLWSIDHRTANEKYFQNHRGNFQRRMKDLCREKVFHMFKSGNIISMSVDVFALSWSYFNNGQGRVAPLSILQMIENAPAFRDMMISAENSNIQVDTFNQDYARFISNLVGQVDRKLSVRLPKFEVGDGWQYIRSLADVLRSVDEFAGFANDPESYSKLPSQVYASGLGDEDRKFIHFVPQNSNLESAISHDSVSAYKQFDSDLPQRLDQDLDIYNRPDHLVELFERVLRRSRSVLFTGDPIMASPSQELEAAEEILEMVYEVDGSTSDDIMSWASWYESSIASSQDGDVDLMDSIGKTWGLYLEQGREKFGHSCMTPAKNVRRHAEFIYRVEGIDRGFQYISMLYGIGVAHGSLSLKSGRQQADNHVKVFLHRMSEEALLGGSWKFPIMHRAISKYGTKDVLNDTLVRIIGEVFKERFGKPPVPGESLSTSDRVSRSVNAYWDQFDDVLREVENGQ